MLLRNFFLHSSEEHKILVSLKVLQNCSMADAPISAVVCFRYQKHLVETCSAIKNGSEVKSNLQIIEEYGIHLSNTLRISITHGCGAICANFLEYLVDKVKKVHANDRAELLEHVESGIYNPESGVAYYFTPHGSQVHKQPDFAINPVSKTYDNDPMVTVTVKFIYTVLLGNT